MKRLGLVLAFYALLSLGSAQAQLAGGFMFPGPGMPASSGGAGYSGPGDVFSTSPKGWFSCARAYSASYASTTGSMCDVVITSTGTAACTIKATTSGFADLAGTYCAGVVNLATACAAGCSVTKMYDQTGNGCHVTQTTLASMPLLLLSSTPTGTLPAVQASSTVGTLQATSCAAITTQPVAFSGVIIRTSGTTTAGLIGASGAAQMGFDTAGNAYVNAGTSIDLAAANSSWHAVNALANGAGTASAINVDGTDQTGAAGTSAIPANSLRVGRVIALTGTVALAEVGIWNAVTTSTDRNNVCKNQAGANGYNTAFGC